MNFQTKTPIAKSQFPIDYNSRIMSLGSCFAENMSEKFDYFKFQNVTNPFGIIFNAVSLERIIERIVNLKDFTEKDIFYHNEMWHCFEVHSELSHPDKEAFLNNLNEKLAFSYYKIMELSHCIITFGTSWVYRNIETNQIVANCHKMPQKQFTKELLSTAITQKSIENIISLIHSVNKNVKFIFTISPVRHIKDGFFENNVSKAILLQTIYKLLNSEIGHLKSASYFPSFEIIQDELRDYRFYKEDMLHPNQTAINYVWGKFVETSIYETSISMMNEIENIQKMINHKPINPNSLLNQGLNTKIKEKILKLQEEFPQIFF